MAIVELGLGLMIISSLLLTKACRLTPNLGFSIMNPEASFFHQQTHFNFMGFLPPSQLHRFTQRSTAWSPTCFA